MKVKAGLAAVAIAGGAAAAVAGPAGPALGFFSPPLLLEIHANSPASLVAKGSGVDVIVRVECSGSSTAFVGVQLTQRIGSDTAIGFGNTEIGCTTNANQNVLVLVTAEGTKAFKKGPAVAQAEVNACTPNFRICGQEIDTPTIAIGR
jgi:hypothetical protein